MNLREEVFKAVRGFVAHGVVLHGEVGANQVLADCPFSGKAKKFYINWTNKLWDSKVAGLSGNFEKFLEETSKLNVEAYQGNVQVQSALAQNRRLPRSAFKEWELGWNGDFYTLPVRNAVGKVIDLRTWKLGGKLMSTPGVQVGLFGCPQLCNPKRTREPVFICEGEWDAIALNWLLRLLGKPGICVGVPGANTFKADWVPWFQDRDVTALYDNDEPGENGELRCYECLRGVAKSLRFVHWPSDAPEGFDVRDWIVYGSVQLKTPRKCWEVLQKLLDNPKPRRLTKAGTAAEQEGEPGSPARSLKPINRAEMVTEFRKWLHLKNEDALAVLFGACFANRLEGDPLWLFIVAPPGGMKSELLMSLSASPQVYACSSLTPHALVSGANWTGGGDPSLIPKLDGKILVVKDFTTTLAMNPMARDEIFGQLRDCYDGKFEKQFGNGVVRRYESTFGILAGVTPSIDSYSSLNMGLGERFLKYRIEGNLQPMDEEVRILRAIGNINREVSMREHLQDAAARFMSNEVRKLPEFGREAQLQVARLAMLAARMRGVVNRDRYNTGLLTSKASHEIGTRLGKQLSKVAIGIACYFGERAVGAEALRLTSEIAMATVPDKVEEIVRSLWELCPGPSATAQTRSVCGSGEHLTLSTVFRGLQDLAMIGVVRQIGSGAKYLWQLSDKMRNLIQSSGVYKTSKRRKEAQV